MEWICSICGYVYEGVDVRKEESDYVCPLCEADIQAFEQRNVEAEVVLAAHELK